MQFKSKSVKSQHSFEGACAVFVALAAKGDNQKESNKSVRLHDTGENKIIGLVWLWSDWIGFLIAGLKHLDYSIDSCITRLFWLEIFILGPWAGSRRTAAVASFLQNNHKLERHCASSLCNYHVQHIRNVQRCSFVSIFVRHLSRMPRQLVT